MKKTLHYKGYEGSVEWDDENEDILYGRILHITDRVSYHGKNVLALKKAFSEAVKDYLETCEEVGKAPDKPYRGTFNIRVAPDLHEKVARRAAQVGVSLNKWIEQAIVKAISRPARN